MTEIVAFLPNATACERLRKALAIGEPIGLPRHVRFVNSWAELHSHVQLAPAAVALVDPVPTGVLALEELATVCQSFPSLSLVAYGDFRRVRYDAVLRLASLGVTRLVCFDEDDRPETLNGALAAAVYEHAATSVFETVRDLLPPHLEMAVRVLIADSARLRRPADLAAVCRCHPKTLRQQLRAAGLPSTAKLIIWTRLLTAVRLLGDEGRSVRTVVEALHFPSVAAFHNQLRRYVHMAPSEARTPEGAAVVAALFRRACARSRLTSPAPRSASLRSEAARMLCASSYPASYSAPRWSDAGSGSGAPDATIGVPADANDG